MDENSKMWLALTHQVWSRTTFHSFTEASEYTLSPLVDFYKYRLSKWNPNSVITTRAEIMIGPLDL